MGRMNHMSVNGQFELKCEELMSINLHLEATRYVTVNKTGKLDKQTIYFKLWQTPSTVSYQAMENASPKGVYVNWVNFISKDTRSPVFEDGDLFCERDPIGYEIVNEGKEHITLLEDWIKQTESEGYDLEWSAW